MKYGIVDKDRNFIVTTTYEFEFDAQEMATKLSNALKMPLFVVALEYCDVVNIKGRWGLPTRQFKNASVSLNNVSITFKELSNLNLGYICKIHGNANDVAINQFHVDLSKSHQLRKVGAILTNILRNFPHVVFDLHIKF